MKPHHQTPVWSITSIAVVIVLAFQALMTQTLIPRFPEYQAAVVVGTVLGSTGFYILLFRLFLIFYRRFLWKFINPDINLNRCWDLAIMDQGGLQYRIGSVFIKQDFDDIEILGSNYDAVTNELLVSIWNAEEAWIYGMKLHFNYKVKRAVGDTGSKTGRAVMNLDGLSPPQVLRGIYNDVSPSKDRGSLIFKRISRK